MKAIRTHAKTSQVWHLCYVPNTQSDSLTSTHRIITNSPVDILLARIEKAEHDLSYQTPHQHPLLPSPQKSRKLTQIHKTNLS